VVKRLIEFNQCRSRLNVFWFLEIWFEDEIERLETVEDEVNHNRGK
jgi:hypothetical protein